MDEEKESYRGMTVNVKVGGSDILANKLLKLAIELIDKGVSTPDDVTSIAGVVYAYKEVATMEQIGATHRRDEADIDRITEQIRVRLGYESKAKKSGNITPLLCDALSKLTCREWKAIYPVMDSKFNSFTLRFYDELQETIDPMTCGATGSEIYEGAKAWLGRSATCGSEKESR